MTDERWMREALALAARGAGRVSPNPLVGCVLVKDGRAVARGWHDRFGGPHAEAAALKAAGRRARGATAYVNLEPCCHFGKTPPCTRALAAAGVRKVVAAMPDPNPRVSGRGFAELRRSGVAVAVGVLRAEAQRLNRAFAVNMTLERPYVILKAAASLDGKIATAAGESKWITSEDARREAHRLRAASDAVLVGINTILKDDPELTSHGQGRDPVRVVLDTDLKVPPRARILRGGPTTVIATARRSFPKVSRLKSEHLCLIRVRKKGRRIDLRDVLSQLWRMGLGTVLVEGGAETHTSFLREGLVDEVRIFLAPRLIGGNGARTFFEGEDLPLARSLRLAESEVRPVGPDFLFTGVVRRN